MGTKEQLARTDQFEDKIMTAKAVKGAIALAIQQENERRWEADEYPLGAISMPIFLVKLFRPENLRYAVIRYSSIQFGKHIAYEAFPIGDDYNQAFGWKEKSRRVDDGVNLGLHRDTIEWGFDVGCEELGINPEFSFSQDPQDISIRDVGASIYTLF